MLFCHLQHMSPSKTQEGRSQQRNRAESCKGPCAGREVAYLLVPGGHGALHVLVAGEEGHDAVRDHGGHLQQEVSVVPDHRCEGSEVGPSPGLGPPPHSPSELSSLKLEVPRNPTADCSHTSQFSFQTHARTAP